MDGHIVIYPGHGTQKTDQLCCHELTATYCTALALTERMSTDNPMWYSVPYHATTLQMIYGPIPVLPATIDPT